MLTALVLVCSLSVISDIQNCNPDTARSVLRLPAEFETPAACFMQGQALLAATSFGQELSSDDRVKVVCVRSETVNASLPRPLRK
jgi:hypothetical protein